MAQFMKTQDHFKQKMNDFTEDGNNNMIFTEDLKSMVHISDGSEDDLALLRKMIAKFNQQNKELRFGNFVFGPVIMRMCHYLNKPDEALAVFKEESSSQIFDQLITYQILMDLLFINGKYDEILEVFEMIKEKQLQGTKYPKNIVVLFMAACYKLNTPDTLKRVTDLWQELQEIGHSAMRRAATFAAGLALRQNSPHIALEIIGTQRQQNYVTVRNIRAAALADIGRRDDAVASLRSVLLADEPGFKKGTVYKEVVDKVRESVERCSDKEIGVEFERIEKQLIQHGLISEESLESCLCSEIAATTIDFKNSGNRMLAESYKRRSANVGYGGGSSYRRRPGLIDMN